MSAIPDVTSPSDKRGYPTTPLRSADPRVELTRSSGSGSGTKLAARQ